jgi:hypothetical protein
MALPLIPIGLKFGAAAVLAWGTQRALRARIAQGRTDQRAEDALDDLPEGLATHSPRDRGQSNASARIVRGVSVGGRRYHLDIGLIARWKIKRIS